MSIHSSALTLNLLSEHAVMDLYFRILRTRWVTKNWSKFVLEWKHLQENL